MNRDHPFVVVGCGSLGCAALYWLSRAAAPYASVLGLEGHRLGHPHGAGPDHDAVVGLCPPRGAAAALDAPARDAWRQVESLSGQRLVVETGGLVISDGEGAGPPAVDAWPAAAPLDATRLAARWPQFRLRGDERAVHRPGAGILDAHRAGATHVALARGHGAQVREHTPVRALHDAGRHVEVVTDDEVYRAEHVVVATGARTNDVLDGVAAPLALTVTQEQVTRYATPNLIDFSPGRFPVFAWDGVDTFQGVPVHGDVATQLGQSAAGPEVPADGRTDEPDPLRRKRQDEFLADRLPGFGGPELATRTYLSTVAADGEVVLGTVPSAPRVGVALGAGHAPGLASLLGRISAELATTGATRHPVDRLGPGRPGLTPPPDGSRRVPLRSRSWT